MKKITFIPTLLLLLLTITTFSQSLKSTKLYTVSTKGNDVLHYYDFDTQTWAVNGETGTENLKALAFDNFSKTLYGVNEGKLGTIDITTGLFTLIGSVNIGEGEYGTLLLDDIQDLAFDVHHKMLYAIHRVPGNGPGTNDVIFKIDPTTGLIIKNELLNDYNNLVDYVIIDKVYNTENDEDLYDVSGISFDPYTRQFFAIHMQQDNSATQDYNETVISELEIDSDEILLDRIVYDTPLSNMHELCYGSNGEFYSIESSLNAIINTDRVVAFNLAALESERIGEIEPVGTSNNFRSLACDYAINDLALKIALNSNQALPITQEDIVTFDVTIYNQGKITIDALNLVAYITDDVYLNDANWTLVDNTAYKSIEPSLEPGASVTTTLQVKVKEEFEGEIITAVEIESAISNNFTDDEGYPIRLPDIDSQPDDYNNETDIVDNDISGGGIFTGEDEDDHDIATIKVNIPECDCFSVALNNGVENDFYRYDAFTSEWLNIGKTSTTDLKSLTYVQKTSTLYGVEQGKLGTIDVATGQFTSFGVINSGEGEYGTLVLDDIEGLTYNPELEVLYAVHRVPGDGPGTNDVLFQIDTETGLIKQDAMVNPDGTSIDYVTISQTYLGENISEDTYDVYGITYNPYTHQLVALQTKEGADQTLLTEINKNTGGLESVLFDEQSRFLKGLTLSKNGLYYAIGNYKDDLSEMLSYDIITREKSTLGLIDPTGTSQDFQSLACQTPVIDLALKVTLSEYQTLPITAGWVLYDVTIYNQGNVQIDGFTLSSYFDKDKFTTYEFSSNSSVQDNKVYQNFQETIEPGNAFHTTIGALLKEDTKGSITTSVEINRAYSYRFTDDNGHAIPLTDVDSDYDDIENEVNIVNNEINGGGKNVGEDEDDHDIATIEVNIPECNCFSVALNNGAENDFYQYDIFNDEWINIGKTGTTDLKSLTYVQKTSTLYGVEQGKLGTIDVATGQFTSFGVINSGEGEYGTLVLDDIEGLAYDPHLEVLFAVHRVPGDGPGTNDVLFQIDPETGLIKQGAMDNPDDSSIDYVTISQTYLGENISEDTYDVYDITYNPYTRLLVALQTKEGADQTLLTEINENTGGRESVLFDQQSKFLKGLTVSKDGQYYATGTYQDNLSEMISFDLLNGGISTLGFIDPTGTSQNFQSLACQTPVNDLALKVTLNPNQTLPIVEQDLVTFEITIYNQGEVTVDEINLVNYMPGSVYLEDDSWTLIGNSAYKAIKQTIQPGTFITTNLQVEIDDDFDGEIRTAVEIESAISNNFTDNSGNPIPLPDIDSQPDDDNSEINIVDNEINGGGLNKNEDEDDHDITYFNVGIRLYIPDSPCYAVAHNNGNLNALRVYDKVNQSWQTLGSTGTTGIKAIAVDDANGLIYAINNGVLGTISSMGGVFTSIGIINTGNGDHGNLILDNIYGLAYDADLKILFASHRINGNDDDSSNDVIFQIDPATGLLIPNAMLDYAGNALDYAVVPTHIEHGDDLHNLRDITDLTINPYTGVLYAMLSNNNTTNILFEIDKKTAEFEKLETQWGENDVLGSVTFASKNQVYATLNSPNGETHLVLTDLQTNSYTQLNLVDANNTVTDFLSLDCANYAACIDERYISKTLSSYSDISSGLYKANYTIISDGKLSGENVSYKAGNLIQLDSGFEVPKGSDFSADIEDCK